MKLSEIELEALIKKTTAEVVNRTMKESHKLSFQDVSMGKVKQLLLIIPVNVMNLEESIRQIENRYCDSEMSIASFKRTETIKFESAKEIYDLNDEHAREDLANNINKYEEIIFLSPELKQMRALVENDDSGFLESLVIYSLLHRKKTVFLFDYDVQALPANSFGRKLKDLLGSISEMGVLIEVLMGARSKKTGAVTVHSKELITQIEVEDFYKNGTKEILCEKGCIITPLARDAAREMGINLIQLGV